MWKLIDANGTQASVDWSQIDWQKVEKTGVFKEEVKCAFQWSPRSSRMR